MLDKFPEPVLQKIMEASEKIGAERAIIALQGLIHINYPIRIIDGVVRQELINGINHVLKTNEIEAITVLYQEKIETRFPGTFVTDLDEGEYDEVAPADLQEPEIEKVVSPKTRRVK